MFEVIKKKLEEKKKKEKILKLAAIRAAVIEFYEALNAAKGGVNIPACLQARDAMKENVKTDDDINRIYKSLVAHKKAKKAVA